MLSDIQYYYLDGDSQLGPFDLEAFKQQPLKSDTMVWRTGLEDWIMASQLIDLDGLFADAPEAQDQQQLEVIHAGFFERLAAFIFDNIIVAVPSFFVVPFVLGLLDVEQVETLFPTDGQDLTDFYSRQLVASLVSGAVFMIYEVFFYLRPGHTTPGKRMLGLYVMTDQYAELTPQKAIARSFGKMITAFTCLIGYIIAIYDDKNRTLHDLIGGTTVVKLLK